MKKNFKRWIAFFMAFTMCLLCIPTDAFASTTTESNVTWNGNFAEEVPLDDYAYSFAVVGDTQAYVKLAPDKFNVLYDWILNNRVEQKIKFVMGLGDITDDNTPDQWAVAKEQIKRLDGYVPYSVTIGNHDGYFHGINDRTYFNQAFPYEEYQYTVDGAYTPAGADGPNMENTYQTFEAGGRDYLVIALNYAPDKAELAWADEVAKAHPNHNVIVTTHGYLRYTSTAPTARDELELIDMGTTGSNQDASFNSAQGIQDFVDANSNIVMVLCGHECYNGSTNPIGCRERTREDGSSVVEMLIDPQVEDAAWNSRAGLISMLYFSEDGKTVQVRYYSTTQEKYYTELSQFTINDMPVIEKEAKDAIFYEEYQDVSVYRSASGKTAPQYDGYLFAGWMKKDGDKYVPIKESEDITGSAYAKFVTEDVLQVKAQITANTEATTESTNLRLVTTLDAGKYLQTGFVVTANGTTLTLPISDVYDEIVAKNAGDSFEYEPTDFCEVSDSFATVIITGMSKEYYDADFHVTPYWKTLDGTTVYGADRYIHVRDGYTDTVSANIHVENEAELAAGMYYVTYDTENLDYLGYDAGTVFDTVKVAEVDEANGVIGFVGTLSEAGTTAKADGVLANINFTRTNGEATNFTFETVGEQFCDASETDLRFNVEDIEVIKVASASSNVRPFMLMSSRSSATKNLELNITRLNFNQWLDSDAVPDRIFAYHDCTDSAIYSEYGMNGPYTCDAIMVNGEEGVISSVIVMDNSNNIAIDKLNTYGAQEGDVLEIPNGAVATGQNGYQVTFTTGIKLELVFNTATEKLEWQEYQEKPTSYLDVEMQAAWFGNTSLFYFYTNHSSLSGSNYVNTLYKTNKITVNGKRGVIDSFGLDANSGALNIRYNGYEPKDGDVLIIPQCQAYATYSDYKDLGVNITYGAKYYYDGDTSKWISGVHYNEGISIAEYQINNYAGAGSTANSFNVGVSPNIAEATTVYNVDNFVLNGREGISGKITAHNGANWVQLSIDSAHTISANDILEISAGTLGQCGFGSVAQYIKIKENISFIYNGTAWIVAKQYPSDATYEPVYVGNFNYRTGNMTVIRTESTMALPSTQDKLYYTDEILINGVRGIIDKVYVYSGGANIYIAGGSYTPAVGDVITIPMGARAVSTDGYYIQFGNGFQAMWNENLDLTDTGTPTNELTREVYYYDLSVEGFAYNGGKVDGVTYAFNMYLNMPSDLQSYLSSTLSGWQSSSDFVITDSAGEHRGAINRFPLVLDSTKGMIAVLQSSYSDGFKPTNGAVLKLPKGAVITPENAGVYSGFVITEDCKVCYYNDQWCEDNAAPTIYYNNSVLADGTTIQVKEGYTADRLQACFTANDKVTGDNVTLLVEGLSAGELTTGASTTVTAEDIFGNKVSYVVTVEVKQAVIGDANDDDVVSVKDIVYFANWNNSLEGYEILKPTKRFAFMYNETASTYDMTKLFEFILDSCKPEASWL